MELFSYGRGDKREDWLEYFDDPYVIEELKKEYGEFTRIQIPWSFTILKSELKNADTKNRQKKVLDIEAEKV